MSRPTRTQLKIARLQVKALEAELRDPICRRYPAAAKCVQETLGFAQLELARLEGAALAGRIR